MQYTYFRRIHPFPPQRLCMLILTLSHPYTQRSFPPLFFFSFLYIFTLPNFFSIWCAWLAECFVPSLFLGFFGPVKRVLIHSHRKDLLARKGRPSTNFFFFLLSLLVTRLVLTQIHSCNCWTVFYSKIKTSWRYFLMQVMRKSFHGRYN